MKNFPNQVSNFDRVRAALALIKELGDAGNDPSVSEVLGYECARCGIYTFRNLDFATATKAEVEAAIKDMKAKDYADQGPLTFARDVRRTLRFLGWIDSDAQVTAAGEELLATVPGQSDEQAVLVEGLMNIYVPDREEKQYHHPTLTLLKLLEAAPSYRRDGLELAFQPLDDSDLELQKALAMYPLPRPDRIRAMGTSVSQRNNAVKILPSLCVYAGLIVEQDDHYFYLSQEGWALLGQPTPKSAGSAAKRVISQRGRRTTVGKKVTSDTIAQGKIKSKLPRTLSPEEQARAAERLQERTRDHQALVKRMAQYIGDNEGTFFEDEFAYDMLWVPHANPRVAYLFEMKTITGLTDAHGRVRSAVGQLSYYEYFHAGSRLDDDCKIQRVVVVDGFLPDELCGYLTYEGIAAISYPDGGWPIPFNSLGERVRDALPGTTTSP